MSRFRRRKVPRGTLTEPLERFVGSHPTLVEIHLANVRRGDPERDEEESCDALIRGLGGDLYDFSVRAATHIKDCPDRRYFLKGVGFWAEIKARAIGRPEARERDTTRRMADKLTRGQFDFLRREQEHGSVVFAGDREMLQQMTVHRTAEWRHLGWACVAEVAARGLRDE